MWLPFAIISTLFLQQCYGGYVALAPTEFHPGWKYKVHISVTGASGDTTVIGRIKSAAGESFSQSQTIPNGQSKLLEITVDADVQPGQYQLELEGTGGLSFRNTTDISLDPLTRLTFIQTDKTIYKPGQTVMFRTLSVDKSLIPQQLKYDVELSNPKGSKLAIFESGVPVYVLERNYTLTEFPDLGEWTLTAKNSDTGETLETLSFKVDEYVPPKAEVTVDATPGYLISGSRNTDVQLDITAKYTYGKGLLGAYVITIGSSGTTFTGKITDPSGMKSVTLSLASELSANTYGSIPIKVEVTDETGRTYEASTSVRIESQPVKIEIDRSMSQLVYRTGMGLHVVAKVTDPDGAPLTPEMLRQYAQVSISLTDYSDTANSVSQRFDLAQGQTDVVWDIPPITSNRDSLTLKVDLLDSPYSDQVGVTKFKTVGTRSLRINTTPVTLTVGLMMKFSLDLSNANDFSSIFYMIVSRGNIQASGTVTPGQEMTVKVSTAMCPQGRLIVYGITNANAATQEKPEVIADSIDLKLNHCQEKTVSTTMIGGNNNQQRTGTNATLSVAVGWADTTNTGMVGQHDVYMLGVDKSIIILEGDNDIKPAAVEEGLEKFNLPAISNYNNPWAMARRRRSIMPPGPYPGESPSSTGELLQGAGVEVLSDIALFEAEPFHPIYYDDMMLEAERADADAGAPVNEMPQAGLGGTGSVAPVKTVRKDFPDTWLFEHVRTDDNGLSTFTRKLPDTITSWVVSGFAVRENQALAVTNTPLELRAFNPFFVTLNLPYSIRRMEEFVLRATVFNYKDQDKLVTVTLTPSDDFQIKGSNTVDIMVRQGLAASHEFTIVANKVKTIMLTVKAESDPDIDIIDKKLRVKPEGIERMRALTFPVILSNEMPQFEQEVDLDFSPWTLDDVTPESRRAMVTVTGDMMGNALENIDKLLSVPFGCGEQNMITTVPNIFALKYVKAINDIPQGFEEKAKENMKKGFQKETGMYRWTNGGYSAFGENSDESASTWLTAFVLKSFSQAREFIGEEMKEQNYDYMLTTAADFLLTKQQSDGSFREDGRVIHTEMTSGTAGGKALTVYVTICLLEAKKAGIQTSTMLNGLEKALTYLENTVYPDIQSQPQNNLYMSSLLAFAMAMEKTRFGSKAIDLLDAIDVEGVAPWKKKAGEETGTTRPPVVVPFEMSYHPPSAPKDVEVTSYCLLAYHQLAKLGRGRELVLWLQKEGNPTGGYRSTQDTVMALQAISEYAVTFRDGNPSATVLVQALDPAADEMSYTINSNNAVLLKYLELPDETNRVRIRVTGNVNSLAVVKVVWYFYTSAEKEEMATPGVETPKKITLKTVTTKVREGVYQVEACFKPESGFTDTNVMMLGHFEKPSGTNLLDIQQTRSDNKIASRVEETDEVVDYYFPAMTDGCVRMDLEETVVVKNRQGGAFTLASYYDPDTKAEAKVEIMEAVRCEGDSCTTCEGGDCNAGAKTTLSRMLLAVCVCLLASLLLAV